MAWFVWLLWAAFWGSIVKWIANEGGPIGLGIMGAGYLAMLSAMSLVQYFPLPMSR